MSQTIEYLITASGVQQRIVTETALGNAEALLTQVLSTRPTIIPNVGLSDLGLPFHLRQKGDITFIAEEIPHLYLNTTFRLATGSEETPFLVPVFQAAQDANSLQSSPKWCVPEGMTLVFLSLMRLDGTHVCYLVAYDHAEDSGQYILPLPNVYSDGKLCMGPAFEANRVGWVGQSKSTWLPRHARARQSFFEASWNADLLEEYKVPASAAMFRYTGGFDQATPPEDWQKYCRRAGSDHYDWVYDIIKART